MVQTALIATFTVEQVERLTGVSKGQLAYWDRTKFFTPSLADDNRRVAYGRLYSFRDLVCLKILNTIRNEIRVPLPHLREVKDKLAHLDDDLWAKTTLYVHQRRVVFDNPETAQREEVVSGQALLQIPLRVVTGDMERAVKSIRERPEQTIGQVSRRRGVASHQPVVAGTRIPVRAIKAFRDAGYTVAQIRGEYPGLTEADIEAALRFNKKAA
jgi:uncharacterized protein (DUF433 family)